METQEQVTPPCRKSDSQWQRTPRLLTSYCQSISKSSFPATLVPQTVKKLPAMQETQVWSLGREDPLEEGMATHSRILAWRIPWTEEPGELQSMGSQRDHGVIVSDTTHAWDPDYTVSCLSPHSSKSPSLFAQTDAVTFSQCGLTDFTPDFLTQSLHNSKSTKKMDPTSNPPVASPWSSKSSLWLQLSRPQHDTARSQGCLSLALLMGL